MTGEPVVRNQVAWKYAHDDCDREHGIYEHFTHDTKRVPPGEMPSGDRQELMWCTSCEAYLWGVYTVHEVPW